MAGIYQNTVSEEQKKKTPYINYDMQPGEGVLMPGLPVNSEIEQPQVQQPAQAETPIEQPLQAQAQAPAAPVEQTKPAILPGMNEEIAGMRLQSQAAQAKAVDDNKVISQLSQKQIADAQEIETKRNEFEKEQSTKLDSYNKELETLSNTPIKSPDWWGSKTTGEKIMAGVGLFFAALGNQGQMQRALSNIDKQIDDDIKLQEKNLDSRKEGVRAKIGILDKMRSVYGDIESSKIASKKAAYEGLARQLEINANNANSKMAQAQLMQGVAKAKQESAKYNDLLAQRQQELEIKKAELGLKLSKGGNLTPAQKIVDEEFAKDYKNIKDKLPETRSKIGQLREAIQELGSSDNITGPIAGRVGGILNPRGAVVQDKIKGLMVETVKQLFPGATSDFEVQAAVERAYNPLLPEKENVKKLLPILEGVENAYKNRVKEVQEYQRKGTLSELNSSDSSNGYMDIIGDKKTASDRKKELEAKMSR